MSRFSPQNTHKTKQQDSYSSSKSDFENLSVFIFTKEIEKKIVLVQNFRDKTSITKIIRKHDKGHAR